jgi:hypothetical protein
VAWFLPRHRDTSSSSSIFGLHGDPELREVAHPTVQHRSVAEHISAADAYPQARQQQRVRATTRRLMALPIAALIVVGAVAAAFVAVALVRWAAGGSVLSNPTRGTPMAIVSGTSFTVLLA